MQQSANTQKGNRLLRNFRVPFIQQDNNSLIIKLKKHFIDIISSEFLEVEKPFELTDDIKPKLAFCFNWVLGHNIDWKENKGLQLYGEIGTGKSCIIKAVVRLTNELYNISGTYAKYTTANKIASLYRCSDNDSIIKINQLITCKLLFIDDIGTEDKKVFDSFPIQEIVRERYDTKKFVSFTTNLSPAILAERYTASIEDKLSHGTYRIEFTGNSKR